jgi:hypothetical protein
MTHKKPSRSPQKAESCSEIVVLRKWPQNPTSEFEDEEMDARFSKFRHWLSWEKQISFDRLQPTGSVVWFAPSNDRLAKV